MKLIKTAFAFLSLALLTACGGVEGDFEEAINASIGESDQCWSVRNNAATSFPLKVSPGMFSDGPSDMLSALEANGIISLETKTQSGGYLSREYYEVSLTEKGRKSGAWDPQKGFCIGHREVSEIVRYTYAGQGANENAASVTYTWEIEDVPGWVDRDAFAKIDGMSGPVEATSAVQKSSDGWHMVGW